MSRTVSPMRTFRLQREFTTPPTLPLAKSPASASFFSAGRGGLGSNTATQAVGTRQIAICKESRQHRFGGEASACGIQARSPQRTSHADRRSWPGPSARGTRGASKVPTPKHPLREFRTDVALSGTVQTMRALTDCRPPVAVSKRPAEI